MKAASHSYFFGKRARIDRNSLACCKASSRALWVSSLVRNWRSFMCACVFHIIHRYNEFISSPPVDPKGFSPSKKLSRYHVVHIESKRIGAATSTSLFPFWILRNQATYRSIESFGVSQSSESIANTLSGRKSTWSGLHVESFSYNFTHWSHIAPIRTASGRKFVDIGFSSL